MTAEEHKAFLVVIDRDGRHVGLVSSWDAEFLELIRQTFNRPGYKIRTAPDPDWKGKQAP